MRITPMKFLYDSSVAPRMSQEIHRLSISVNRQPTQTARFFTIFELMEVPTYVPPAEWVESMICDQCTQYSSATPSIWKQLTLSVYTCLHTLEYHVLTQY